MSIHIKFLFGLIVGFTQLAWSSIPITQIELWSSEQNYQRGDLVEYQQTAYIALLPSKNIKPKKISVLWRPLQLSSTTRSEEHTSELQSRPHLVCRLLLEKK